MKYKLMSTFAALVIASSSISCTSTSPMVTAYKAEGVVITSVDTGMGIWANYVKAGLATQTQIDSIRNAYTSYYNSQMIAKVAFEQVLSSNSTNSVDIAAATASVSTAQTALLSLLNQFLVPKK